MDVCQDLLSANHVPSIVDYAGVETMVCPKWQYAYLQVPHVLEGIKESTIKIIYLPKTWSVWY